MLELNVTKYSFPDHPDITIEVFGHNSARAIIQKNTSEEQAEEFPCTVLNTGAELVFHVYELRSVDGAPPVPVTLKRLAAAFFVFTFGIIILLNVLYKFQFILTFFS